MRGAAASGLSLAARILVQLLSIPLFLLFWDPERYGEWLLLFTIPAYLSITDFGIGLAGSNAIGRAVSQGEVQKAKAIFSAVRIFVSGANLVLIGIAAFLVFALQVPNQFGFDHIQGTELFTAIFLLCLAVVASLQTGIAVAVMRGIGRYAESTVIGSAMSLVELAAMAAALWLIGRADAVAGALLGVRIVTWALLGLYTYFSAPAFRGIDFSGVGPELRALAKPAFGFFLMPLVNALRIQGFTIVVGIVFGPVSVVLFNTVRAMSFLVWQIIAKASGILMPEVAYAGGRNDLASIRRLHRLSSTLTLLLALGFSVVLLVLGPVFHRLWTLGEVGFSHGLLAVFLASMLVSSIWVNAMSVISGLNRHLTLSISMLIASVIAVAAAYVGASAGASLILIACLVPLADLAILSVGLAQAMRLSGDRVAAFLSDVFSFRMLPEIGRRALHQMKRLRA